jgi:Uncharacterized homolog of phage Mu protein gp47
MYESMTYDVILQRMLDRVSDKVDKREGSVIYDALAPAAVELQLMYIELDVILSETFGDTASREYLIRRAKERGLEPDEATYAVLQGEFTPSTLNIPIGSRFSLNDLNYAVTAKESDGIYQLTCETVGTTGNQYFGTLIPIDYIDGLETAELTEVLVPGEDEEGTEDLRTRYFASFDTQSFSGNKADYLEKTNAISGVGATKITPVWNGGGTVKLTILDANFNKASSILIQNVQNTIDPSQDGEGNGLAPVGHVVTVDTVEEVSINVYTQITYDTGYNFSSLQSQIIQVISEYLLELRKDWANQTELIVRIAQIESRLLSITGILDITGTKINEVAANLTCSQYQIPVMGGVTT